MFRNRIPAAFVLVIGGLLYGCSDDKDSSGAGGAAGNNGGSQGGGETSKGGGRTGGTSGTGGLSQPGGRGGTSSGGSSGSAGTRKPLLEQPQELAFDCRSTTPVTITTSPKVTFGTLGPRGSNGPLLALVSQDFMGGTGTLESGLYSSTLTSTGQLTTPSSVRANWVSSPVMIPNGSGATLVWGETDEGDLSSLWSAQLDGSGTVVRAAAKIHSWPARVNISSFEGASNGSEVRLFVATSNSETSEASIESAPLANNGTLAKAMSVLVQNDSILFLYDAVGFDGGYAMGYGFNDGAKPVGRYVAYDASLTQRHGPVTVELGSSGYWGSRMNLMPRKDRVLMASVNGEGSFETGQIATYVELSTIDNTGKLVGGVERLQAPIADVENGSPLLVPLGNDLGLIWSKGSVIYICAGCTPDNALNFVMLDGSTLRPKSEVVSLPSPDEGGGLTEGELMGTAEDLVLLTSVQYHVTSAMALGRISCKAK